MTEENEVTELSLFNYDEHEVRVVMIDDEPWWVAKDVCAILGLGNTSMAISRIDALDINSVDVENARGSKVQMKAVNEPGLYELIIRSDKPEARAFRQWITKEVLPEIRKTGSYGTVPKSLPEALRAYATEVEARENAQRELAEAQPKVEVFDDWLSSDAIEMTDFAKRIKFTPVTKFTATLRELKILRKDRRNGGAGSFRNLPTAKWEHAFDIKSTQLPNGEYIDVACVNPNGQLDLIEALRDNGHDV